MNTIAQHISTLLYAHDCVIIPSLGGFVATQRTANIDDDRHIFAPPAKEIGFNRSLQHNDGLLITYTAQYEALSYELAKLKVDDFVASIYNKTNSGESFLLSGIGELKNDAMNNLLFVPSKNEGFLPEAFGLTSFHFSPLAPQRRSESNISTARRLLRPISHKQIAASAAIIIGLFVFSPDVQHDILKQNINSASIITLPTNNTVEIVDMEQTTPVTNELVVEAEVTPTTDIAPTNEVVKEVEKNNYFIIAGSFKNATQANDFIQELTTKGETGAFVLNNSQNKYRVALKGFANKDEAVKASNAYRKQTAFSNVWVLSQK